MAKLKLLQGNLNAGELSPLLRGRMDVARYQNGLELCRNMLPQVLGGASSRPGSRYVAAAAVDDVLLFPFTPTLAGVLTGYVLEFSAGKIRFFTAGAQIMDAGSPVEVATPYTAAELENIHYDQFDNTLYLFHGNHPTKQLTRTSDTVWTLADVTFKKKPFYRPAGTDGITLTPSAASGNITLSASSDLFVADHVGVRFQVNGGEVEITAVTNGTTASATVKEAIPTSGLKTKKDVTTITITDPASVSSGHQVVVTTEADYNADTMTTNTTGGVSGVIGISTASSSATLTGTEPDPDWKEEAWSKVRGYPAAGVFHEQRMIVAQTAGLPTGVWGSKIGDVTDFTIGTADDEPFAWTPAAASTPIGQLAAGDQLLALTLNKELTLRGGNDAPLTPTNVKVKAPTAHGCSATVRPVPLGSDVYFSGPEGLALRAFRYRLDVDGYRAPDVAQLAGHLLDDGQGIVDMAWARAPLSSIWMTTKAGNLLSLTIDPDQEVTAWAKHHTAEVLPEDVQAGEDTTYFKSVTVVPDTTGQDQVWIAVQRLVGGTYKTYIEYLDADLDTDSAMTGTDVAGRQVWTGLDHLEGKTVDIVADGYVLPQQVVASGQIDVGFAAVTVQIGLPYTPRIKDLPPYIEGGAGAAASCNNVRVLLHRAQGCTLNGEQLPFADFTAGILDTPIPQFTGWKTANQLSGWADDGSTMQVEIVQNLPLPLTVLAISKEVSING